MSKPSTEQLLTAIESVVVSSGGLPEDSSEDEQLSRTILAAVKDEHFLWKISLAEVSSGLQALRLAAPRKYVQPKKLCKFDFSKGKTGSLLASKVKVMTFDGIHHAQGGLGSSGVFLLKKAGSSKVIVLKLLRSMQSAETAGSLLALYLGLGAPAVRPLSSIELSELVDKLWEVPVTVPGTCTELFGDLDGRFGMLMEFTPGKELNSREAFESFKPASPPKRAAFMEHIGHVITVDMLLNNADRIPYIWRGDGNPGNLLVIRTKDESLDIRAIDQELSPISDPKLLNKYVEKVQLGIEEAMQGLGIGTYIDRVGAFIANCWNTDVDYITTEDKRSIQVGIVMTAANITKSISSVKGQVLSTTHTLLAAAIDPRAKAMLAQSRISLEADFEEFVRPITKAMAEGLKSHDDQ